MKRLALLLMFAPLCVYAQTGVVQGHCYLGGKQATTSGMNSSNYMDGNIPACTVTVYLTGTLTKQTITRPDGSALANPFTANTASAVDPGGWIFRATTNQGLDVVLSGGNSNPSCITAPLCYTQPVTLVDVFPTQSFSPVSGLASATSTLPIQVNGGTGPVTSGNVNVSCANNCAAYGQLLMQVNPPAPAAQQYILYPTSVTGTGTSSNTVQCGGITTGAASCSGSGTLANGGYISHPYCNLSCSTNNIITWTFPSLPSFINPASVTSIYGGMVGYTTTTTLVGNGTTFQFECGKTSQTTVATTQAYGTPLAFGTYTALLSGLVGTDVPSITCDAQMLATDPVQAGIFGNMPSTFLVINYTGSAPPTNTAITVIPPLNFNPGNNSLSLAVPFDVGIDTGAANAYAVSLPWTAQRQPGTTVKFLPVHASTSTTPTFNLNGIGAATIVGPQGGALVSGDLSTTATAVVILDNAGNWRLQDPQVSGSGGGTTTNALTANSSGGASPGDTFNGSAAKTWDYHTFGAAGISGTPTTGNCADWASANTLGDAGAPCGSGGGGGTPGTPAGTVQVYKTGSTFGGTQTWVYAAGINGGTCNHTADETTAFNALLSTVSTAGGGTISYQCNGLFNSAEITVPPNIRITGLIASANGQWSAPPGTTLSRMDLQFNAADAKLVWINVGQGELDHMNLVDTSTDSARFVLDINTTLAIHDNLFSGTASGTSAVNDAIVLGGTTTSIGNAVTDAFQGYGSYITHNFFDKIRSGVLLQVFAQAVPVTNNTWSKTCGGTNLVGAIGIGTGTGTSDGNIFGGNLFETANYPYTYFVNSSAHNNLFYGDTFWDATATTLFLFHFVSSSAGNVAYISHDATVTAAKVSDNNQPAGPNTVMDQGWQAATALAGIQNRYCPDTSGSASAGSCSTNDGSNFTPAVGSLILYHSTTTTIGSGGSFTLNVNGAGAKTVRIAGSSGWTSTLTSGSVPGGAGSVPLVPMVYDGTNWNALETGIAGSGGITALTGDGTATGPGSAALTLATVNSGPGSCGDSTHVCQVTTNGKGLVTSQSAVAISGGGSSFGIPFTVVQESMGGSGAGTSFTFTYPKAAAASGNTEFLVVATGGTTITTPTGWTLDLDYNPAYHVAIFQRASAGDTSVSITVGATTQLGVYYVELAGSRTFDTSSTFNNLPVSNGFNTYSIPITGSITPTAGAWVIAASCTSPPNQIGGSQIIPPTDPSWTIRANNTQVINSKMLILETGNFTATATSTHAPSPNLFTGSVDTGNNAATILFSIK